MFNITQGDLNRTLDTKGSSLNAFATWRCTNHLVAPFEKTLHLEKGYHIWRSTSATQSNTIIDHVLHSPFPDNIKLVEIGTAHSEVNNQISDHLPIWAKFILLDKRLMCDLSMHNEKELENYNIKLSTRLKNSLPKDFYRRTSENTPVISPQRSGK
jgi:hypothetical protein